MIELSAAQSVLEQADRLYSPEQVESCITEMARQITAGLAHSNPIIVCIMNGGMIPAGILLPKLDFPCEVDYVHATRYQGQLAGGSLHWICGPTLSPKGRHILLVDDILDEGVTLAQIEQRYIDEGAVVVRKAVLAIKQRSRKHDVKIDYQGLSVPNRYVFGYGMDYKGYHRNAPGIFAEAEMK